MKGLSKPQHDFFWKNGYLTIEKFLSGDELATLRKTVDQFVSAAIGITASNRVYDLEPSSTPDSPKIRRLFNPMDYDDAFWGIGSGTKILDVLEDLTGPNIQLHHSKVNLKGKGGGSEVCWHQDYPFFPHTNTDLVAVTFYLDDADEGNGCLLVVPGSHKWGPLDHTLKGKFVGMVSREAMERVQPEQIKPLPIKAGGVSLHHSLTLHSSAENKSDRHRRVFIALYRAADAFSLVPDRNGSIHYGKTLRGITNGTARLVAATVTLPEYERSEKPLSLYDLQATAKASTGVSNG